MMCALVAAGRGHRVTLFDRAEAVGGQLNLARRVPGKEEFHGLVQWFDRMVRRAGIDLRLGTAPGVEDLRGFDEVVVATGVTPRDPGIAGQERAISYIDALMGAKVGPRVALVGAGGIGFDVAEFLVHRGESPTEHPDLWRREWGVSDPAVVRGGLVEAAPEAPAREVHLLQRREGRPGKGLGKTTGWIHRAALAMKHVQMRGGVNYEAITAAGIMLSEGPARANPALLEVDTVVLCAGQVPDRGLADALDAAGIAHHVIGGADVAAELDAKRAIDQGARLAARL
jgi:2,4-dienoyl-CoA reductase (NADPH2)